MKPLGLLVLGSIVLGCGGADQEARGAELKLVFEQTPQHALACRLKESGRLDVPRICTQILCGDPRPASQAFADAELAPYLMLVDDLPLGDMPVGGLGPVCEMCLSGGVHGGDVLQCSKPIPVQPSCLGPQTCADVGASHQLQETFVSPTKAGDFTITAQEAGMYKTAGGMLGLEFRKTGVTAELPTPSCSVTVVVGGWKSPVKVEALDATGNLIAAKTTPSLNQPHELTLTGNGIARVRLSGGGGEGYLFNICAKKPWKL
jgi:hypothetical protein